MASPPQSKSGLVKFWGAVAASAAIGLAAGAILMGRLAENSGPQTAAAPLGAARGR
ncbi:MAG: hypothetical protein HXY23_04345, partial [Parvularculaceae bacterium]|nr:hypothetical protein [Parvularculaceae bacterium]